MSGNVVLIKENWRRRDREYEDATHRACLKRMGFAPALFLKPRPLGNLIRAIDKVFETEEEFRTDRDFVPEEGFTILIREGDKVFTFAGKAADGTHIWIPRTR